jgi:hypothetical protein
MIQYGVAALEKDPAISCGLRLVLDHLACSESINITLLNHLYSVKLILTEYQSLRQTISVQ